MLCQFCIRCFVPTDRCLDVPKKKYINTGKNAEYSPYPGGKPASKENASPEEI